MSDEDLIVKISAPGADQAARSVENLADKLEELTYIMRNTGSGSKEFKTLGNEFNTVSKAAREYAKVVDGINKTNNLAAVQQQRLNSEMNKAATQAAKLATEQSKNALTQQRLATEMNKTATSAIRLQMQQDKAAAASERMRIAAEKAAAPYNQMRTALKDYEAKLYNAIAAGKLNDTALAAMGTKYNRLKNELDGVNSKFRQVTNTMDDTKMAGMAFASFLGNLAANVIQNVVSSLGDMVKEISRAGVAMDGITNTFAAGARGWKQGGEEMKFVADTANRLGLNLEQTYEPYAKFMTSFTRSGGTLQESRQIFEDLSEAMVALHLNSAQMQNIFVALEQMANKGTVQAEELKRQLGNALPGAFELAAQSMGITTAELMDMMKAGEVVSRDFLPNFAALVKDSLGKQVGIAVNQYNAHLNRLQSQTFLLKANLGQLWNAAITPLVQGGGELLGVVNKGTSSVKQSSLAITALQTTMIAAGVATVMFVKQFGIVNTTLAVMKTNALAAGKALWALVANPVGATLLAIGAAALYCANSINNANKEIEEQRTQILDVSNNVTGLISEYSQLANIQNRSQAQQEAYNRTLNELKSSYPQILQYMNDNKINLENLTQAQADNIASMAIQQKVQEAELLYQEELSNGWLITASWCKRAGVVILAVIKEIEAAVAWVAVSIGQIFTRTVSVVTWTVKEVAEKVEWLASAIGQKDFATQVGNFRKTWQDHTDYLRNMGKITHSALGGAMKDIWSDEIWGFGKTVEIERQNKALQARNDTIAALGLEQNKLAQQLMYSSNALSDVATGKDGKKKGSSKKGKTAKEPDTEWDMLNKEISKMEEAIKIRKLHGQSIDDLVPKYVRLKKQQEDINKAVQRLTETPKTGFELLKQNAQDATEAYEKMIGNSQSFTRQEIKEAAALMKRANAEVTYYEVLKKRESILQISRREAGKMAESLIDTIFEPLDNSETIWDRFKDAGISALKAIATTWTKNIMNSMLAGFQTNWLNGAGSPLGERFGSGMRGAITGLFGMPLGGYAGDAKVDPKTGWMSGIKNAFGALRGKTGGDGTMTGGAADIAGSYLTGLTKNAENLTTALTSGTNPAVDAANSAISAVANPAMQAANSIIGMAASAPMAAVGMLGISASMTALAPAATTAAPALMQMGAALGTIAANASAAATSMAALAVATAAESVAKIPFVGGFLAPVAAGLTGAAIAAGTIMTGAGIAAGATMAGAGQMLGGAMTGIGNKLGGFKGGASTSTSAQVVPHARGGIVSSPTTFPMQGGNIGLAGEAGTEVIAPAKRMSNGELGVGAVQPKVVVNNYTNAAVEVKKRPDNSIDIKIAELNAMLSSSRTNKGMAAAQSRMDKKGRQIG